MTEDLAPPHHGNGVFGDAPHRCRSVDITNVKDEEKVLTAPLDYLRKSPGKNIRQGLINAFNKFLCVSEEKLLVIIQIIDLLHTASLLIDDIQDSSKLRRGLPVAHSVFGVAQTINSANLAYFVAQRELKKLSSPHAFSIFTEELINLHRGQGIELHWRDTLQCPTEDDYMKMVLNKTGGLLRLAIRLMQAESSNNLDHIPLIETLGMLFQIRDDYLNLQSDTYSKEKGLYEDISEGKFSFPVIHSLRSRPNDTRLLSILAQHTSDDAIKQYAVDYIESSGSFLYCREKIRVLLEEAKSQLVLLEAGSDCGGQLKAMLEQLMVW